MRCRTQLLLIFAARVQAPSIEDLAAGFADSTRQAIGHAQNALETVHQNWSSLLADTSRWADDAGLGKSHGDSPLGALWSDAMPRFQLFKEVRSEAIALSANSRRVCTAHSCSTLPAAPPLFGSPQCTHDRLHPELRICHFHLNSLNSLHWRSCRRAARSTSSRTTCASPAATSPSSPPPRCPG